MCSGACKLRKKIGMHTTPHNGRDTVTTDLSADVIRAVNKSVAILGCYTTLGGNARVGRLQSAGVKQNEIKLTTLIDTDFGIYDIEAQTLSENEVLLHCATSRHYLVQFKWDIESNFVEQVYCSTPVAKNVEEEVFYVGTCIAETAEFDRVAGGSTSGRVCIFKEGRETQIFQAHDNECWSLRFLDRNLLLSGSEAGSISFWDLRRPLSTAAACQR
eukprot:Gregarina_sp_Poly_1__4361@NODE_235_length_10966_cov_193_557758_g208_i0_p6_GENE_NODE_235_length_10966_cov_193_557758_g208_i0NODE_235_length_10966_cov_193_557758_g208_i0_p6_ORF_typecomplete_len216_score29_33ANAPC4_WD40/PF12894_7/0_00053WD40/PF00400_32/6_6e03WD40/PF00400_32/0_0014WD40_like/PF17005_5/0_053_NODE_235_length_10966_cov_193_557758_g208_i014392086